MKNIIFLFALSVIALSSCSDDKTPTDPGGDTNSALLPSTVGSYWINTNVETTPPPNPAPDEDTRTTDSSVVIGNSTYQGRQATSVVYYVNGAVAETTYYNQNSNELFSYTSGIQTDFFSLPAGWVKLADYTATSWKPFPDTTLVDNPITFQGINAVVNGTVTSNSTRGGTSTVTIDNKSYTATQFTSTISMNLRATAMFGPQPIEIPLKFDIVSRVQHVKGIGVVSAITDGFNVSAGSFGSFPSNGNQTTLLRFKINP
ncbi:MAG: hypothetical protein JNL36_02000 [Candidatus Kapabacteria bacterium]|nr:hypothetical protein [Candidatus Kapabacteria bacterium]